VQAQLARDARPLSASGAEIPTFSGSDAGDEETHAALLRLRRRARAQGQKRDGRNSRQTVCLDHPGPPALFKTCR